jgi:hypothetical protein
MKKGDRRRLERLFDGRATLEEELALERDAADDGALAAGLARVRALLAACEALPQPAHERLDVEAFVAEVRAALEHGVAPTNEALMETGAVTAPASGAWWPRLAWSSLAAAFVAGIAHWALVGERVLTERAPVSPAVEHPAERHVVGPAEAVEAGPSHEPRADRTANAEMRATGSAPGGGTTWVLPGIAVPSAPVDGARREVALVVLADVLTRAEVLLTFDVRAPGDAAGFAARADAAFVAEVEGLWPLASLAEALLVHADPDVAARAARYVAARRDALTAGRLARALERELATASAARQVVRLAAASALAELGAFDALARSFDDLCEAGILSEAGILGEAGILVEAGALGEVRDLEALLAAWHAAGREELGPELARALPRGWRPRSDAALVHLGALGRPGADVLARLALEGTPRSPAALTETRRGLRAGEPSGDSLTLLAASPFGASAVEDLLRAERNPSGARLERLCALIDATGSLGALDWLTALARKGETRAQLSLARLPGVEPVATLVELDAEGLVRDDRVWTELVSVDAGRVVDRVREAANVAPDDAERLVACLIGSGGDAAAPVLATAAGEPRLGTRTRERAALALAQLDPSRIGVTETQALCFELEAALGDAWRGHEDSLVAALVVASETWLGAESLTRALHRLGALRAERVVRAAALGSGADSALARQARVERTLDTTRVVAKEPSRVDRGIRGNRGT